MLEAFLQAADVALGWLLVPGGPWPAVGLAVISAVAMVLVRRLVTDQDKLGRCAADKKRLKQLIREARGCRDKAAVKRHKATRTLVQLKLLRAEGWPLLLSIPIIGVLGTWGYYRLAYHPPRSNEAVVVELSLPPSAAGSLATLLPRDGLDANSWIAPVVEGKGKPAHAVARWTVRAPARPEDYTLRMRARGQTYRHPLRVGQPTCAETIRQHDRRFLLPQSVVYLRPMKVLGVIPWFAPTTTTGTILPAWLVTYVLVVVPLVYLLKAVFRIH
jgi:hypothetical protein